jgi:hypothetical protein
MAERLITGEKVTVPDELAGYVASCVRFLDDFDVRQEHVEVVVYSETHRYVGTCDLIARVLLPDMPEYEHIPRDDDGYSLGLFDWKTSKSGIFGDVALQLVAYRHAEYLITDDGRSVDMPGSTSARASTCGRRLQLRPADRATTCTGTSSTSRRSRGSSAACGTWSATSIVPPTASHLRAGQVQRGDRVDGHSNTGSGLDGLAAALAKVQAKLPKLERDRTVEVQQKNGGTYSYSYVTLANLSDSILPLLAEHGLSFAAMPGAGSDGKMCVRYLLMHESGESLPGEFPISGEGGIQMIGGRITYARRYCLAAIVGVAADEDDESRLSEEGGTANRSAGRRAASPAGRRPARARR